MLFFCLQKYTFRFCGANGNINIQEENNVQRVIWNFSNNYTSGKEELLTVKIKLKSELESSYGYLGTSTSTNSNS